MKILNIILVLFISVHSFSADKLFIKADSLFKSNKIKESISLYQKILDKNLESSELYYNIGICYFQIEQFKKMGSFSGMTKFIPGLNKIKNLDNQEYEIKWTKAIIQSMTEKERENPEIINGSRRLRIAKGSGRNVSDVNKLIKQFSQIKVMMKKMSNKKMGNFPLKFN